MDDTRSKKLVVLSLLVAGLSVVFIRDIKRIIDNSLFKNKYVLIIGILSAPENFQRRIGLRRTWLKLTSDISASYYFVIGENICPIHPLDRTSAYSCDELSISLPEKSTSETEFSVVKARPKNARKRKKSAFIGFGFQALRDVTVKKLGVMTAVLERIQSDVNVKLVLSASRKTLASVTITHQAIFEDKSEYFAKAIPPFTLKEGSEAQVVMEFDSRKVALLPSCSHLEWEDKPGVINYLQLIQAGAVKPWPFERISCSYVFMNYTIPDLGSLEDYVSGKERRKREWRKAKSELMSQLKNESTVFGDIVFVGVEDVYRTLPLKLMKFFKWVLERDYFHYILKTDDDSFIDVPRVYNQLLMVNKEMEEEIMAGMKEIPLRTTVSMIRLSKLWWWSNVREFWKVQETGKWREDGYRSAAYPSFPCGGGYVVNKGIVEYLTANSKNLQYFQGEDVSIGIWLSGLQTIQHTALVSEEDYPVIQEKIIANHREESGRSANMSDSGGRPALDACEWSCGGERTSDIPLCSKVQLSESEMYDTWNEYIRNGFI